MVDFPAELNRDHIWHVLNANRRAFDRGAQAKDEVTRRCDPLEAELAAARAETERLVASASWRLTRPLRSIMQIALSSRRAPDKKPTVEPVVTPTHSMAHTSQLDYATWIRTEEAELRDAIKRQERGRGFVKVARLGVVLVKRSSAPLDGALLASFPAGCTILVLDGSESVSLATEAHDRIQIRSVAPDLPGNEVVSFALKVLDVDFFCFLDARDRLSPHALALVADAISRDPQLDLIFADEDWLDPNEVRTRPFFKPAFDLELLRGCDLFGPFTFLRTDLVHRFGSVTGPAWHYDLTSRIAASVRRESIHRIPAVLCHRVASTAEQDAQRAAVIARQLERGGIDARVVGIPSHPEWTRVIYALPQPAPMVSIIVPTRDHAELLQACTTSLLANTAYERFELLVVDNGTLEPDAIALLTDLARDPRVRVLSRPGPFNWSALNNYAASQAAGAFLLLLNNDTVILQSNWLSEIISHAVQPGVGAVGAKVLYPDGRVQHAGLTTDRTGLPRHLLRFASENPVARSSMLELTREVWGLTGACLAISRQVLLSVGGFNEALPIGSNDVDLCLRLTAFGYRLVWTPWAQVEHRELATRGPSVTLEQHARVREEIDRMTRDWGSLLFNDPYLHPALDPTDDSLPFRRLSDDRQTA
jgi:GT2 family glycosyltransferase